MNRHPLEAEDIDAGRAASRAGRAIHDNPHLNALHGHTAPTVEDRQRFEAWRAGWINAARESAQ